MRIQGFFSHGEEFNNLVFVQQGGRWLTDFRSALTTGGDGVADSVVQYELIDDGIAGAALLGILGGAGIIAALAGSDGGGGGGSTSAPSQPTNVSLTDTSAPAVPMVRPTTGANLSGTAEPGSTVNIDLNGDGRPDATAPVDGGGNWTYTPTTPLPDRTQVSVTATDPAGNTGGATAVTVDTAAPSALAIAGASDDFRPALGAIANRGSTNDTTPTLAGTADANSTINVFDNGTHAPLALTGGLMAVLGAVVHAGAGLHDVPDIGKLRNLGPRGRIAAQLVGDDLASALRAGGEHALEESFGCHLVAALLHQDVELGAVLIDGAPHVGLNAQPHKHLVQMPGRSRLVACALSAMREARAEFVALAPDGLVAHDHAALEQQPLDVSQTVEIENTSAPPG